MYKRQSCRFAGRAVRGIARDRTVAPLPRGRFRAAAAVLRPYGLRRTASSSGGCFSGSCSAGAAPVSYTHLDVYKRQVQNLPGEQQGSAIVTGTFNDVVKLMAVRPLDVYKRQVYDRVFAADANGDVRVERDGQFGLVDSAGNEVVPCAVSYTHLDVYKRQGLSGV